MPLSQAPLVQYKILPIPFPPDINPSSLMGLGREKKTITEIILRNNELILNYLQ